MIGFDYTTAKFIQSENGEWTLERDWTALPPTQSELVALFVHTMRLDRIVGAFIHHFAAGDITTAEGLDDATTAELRDFYAAAIDVMTPPAVEPDKGVPMLAPANEKRPQAEEPAGVEYASLNRVQANDAVAPQTFAGAISECAHSDAGRVH